MEEITIKFNVDRTSLNEYLGNTSNVTLEKGMAEFLDQLFSQVHSYCDRCGSGVTENTNVNGTFEVVG